MFTQRIIQKLYHKKIVCEKIILITLKNSNNLKSFCLYYNILILTCIYKSRHKIKKEIKKDTIIGVFLYLILLYGLVSANPCLANLNAFSSICCEVISANIFAGFFSNRVTTND